MPGCISFGNIKEARAVEEELDGIFPKFEVKVNGNTFSWLPHEYFAEMRGLLCPGFMPVD